VPALGARGVIRTTLAARPASRRRPRRNWANAFEIVQGGRIHIEKINYPMLFTEKATPAEYKGRSCRPNVADRSTAEPASLRQGAARRGGEECPHSLGRLENRLGGRRRAYRARLQPSRAR